MKTELKEKMMDVALEHIYKVNKNPDIKLADVDSFDAWIKYDEDWDLNVHEANFGMGEDFPEENDSSKFEWYACAYPVRLGDDGYEHIITEEGEDLFKWQKKGKVTFITDQHKGDK